MKKLTPMVESIDDFTWRVSMVDPDTGHIDEWVKVDKFEFPTKRDALDYLLKRREIETPEFFQEKARLTAREMERQMPHRMMEGSSKDKYEYFRGKKKSKPKQKRKPVKRCRCK